MMCLCKYMQGFLDIDTFTDISSSITTYHCCIASKFLPLVSINLGVWVTNGQIALSFGPCQNYGVNR